MHLFFFRPHHSTVGPTSFKLSIVAVFKHLFEKEPEPIQLDLSDNNNEGPTTLPISQNQLQTRAWPHATISLLVGGLGTVAGVLVKSCDRDMDHKVSRSGLNDDESQLDDLSKDALKRAGAGALLASGIAGRQTLIKKILRIMF